jgi:hypothetical protein
MKPVSCITEAAACLALAGERAAQYGKYAAIHTPGTADPKGFSFAETIPHPQKDGIAVEEWKTPDMALFGRYDLA